MHKIFIFFLLFSLFIHAQNLNSMHGLFKQGKVLGNLTLFNYNIDNKHKENAYANALGGFLKYTTDNARPLLASVRFHHSSAVGPYKNKEQTYLFDNDNGASSLTALSEAFLAYHDTNRVLKAGNLMLSTPMMNDDITRIIPWSYRGIALTSEQLTDTTIQFNYITHIRSNTSEVYKKESGSGSFDQGISMFGFNYQGVDELSLQSYYYHAPELYSTFIGQVDYKHIFKGNLFCFGLQYFKSGKGGIYNDPLSANGGDDIDLLAFRFGIDEEKYGIILNYSQNFGLSGIVKGYGGLAKVYTTSMVANGRGNFKPETWMLKSHFDMEPGIYGQTELALWLTHTRVNDPRGKNFNAYYSHIRHYVNPNTSIYLRFESIDYLNGQQNDATYLRLITAFDF